MPNHEIWVTKGFEDFRKGRFGNAGQNLYVSRAGVLQRIHQYDLTGNGYVDLVFINSDTKRVCRPPDFFMNVLKPFFEQDGK